MEKYVKERSFVNLIGSIYKNAYYTERLMCKRCTGILVTKFSVWYFLCCFFVNEEMYR